MAYHSERWSRGCGTGVGLSGHKNQYRQGVTIENWVEDDHAKSDALHGNNLFGEHGAALNGVTTMQADFNEGGKIGMDLLENTSRVDLDYYKHKGQDIEHVFPHGLQGKPNGFYDTSLNQLTFAPPGETEKMKVHQYLWAGSKFNDAKVPHGGEHPSLAEKKKAQAAEEMAGFNPYVTTSKRVAETVVGVVAKRDSLLPKAVGGQEAQVGRKAKGEMCETFNQSYQKIGLRK